MKILVIVVYLKEHKEKLSLDVFKRFSGLNVLEIMAHFSKPTCLFLNPAPPLFYCGQTEDHPKDVPPTEVDDLFKEINELRFLE